MQSIARGWRWTRWAAVGAALAAAAVVDVSAWFAIPVLFILIVPFEKLFPRHPQRVRRPQVGLDLTYAALQPLLQVAGVAVAVVIGLVSLAWIPGLLLRPVVMMVPESLRLYLGFALFDLAIYWVHRWSHDIAFLWRFHSIHHSTEHLDWISGFRGHPVDGAILAPPFVLLLAAGFDPEFAGVLVVVQIVSGLFLHANVRWQWKPLHRIVITPEFHHWHHSNEPDARSTNHSVFFPIWDILFGTYYMPRDRRPETYGVSDPVPADLFGQLAYPLRGLPSARWCLRHPIGAAKRTTRAFKRGCHLLYTTARQPRRQWSF